MASNPCPKQCVKQCVKQCNQALQTHCTKHLHGRTDGRTNEEVGYLRSYLTFGDAREKKPDSIHQMTAPAHAGAARQAQTDA